MSKRRQKKKHGKKRKKHGQKAPEVPRHSEHIMLTDTCYHGRKCAFVKSRIVDGVPEMWCTYRRNGCTHSMERVFDIYRGAGECPADKWWMYRENDCIECVGVPVEVERKRKPRSK